MYCDTAGSVDVEQVDTDKLDGKLFDQRSKAVYAAIRPQILNTIDVIHVCVEVADKGAFRSASLCLQRSSQVHVCQQLSKAMHMEGGLLYVLGALVNG